MRIHTFSMLFVLLSIFVSPNDAGPLAANVTYQVVQKTCAQTSMAYCAVRVGFDPPQLVACGARIATCEKTAVQAARLAAAIPFI